MVRSIMNKILKDEDCRLQHQIEAGERPHCSVSFPEIYYDFPKPNWNLQDYPGDVACAQKLRVSGLSQNSNGLGRNRQSVYHAIAIKVIDRGRYQRQPKQFLCSAKQGWGTVGSIGNSITCKYCLDKIHRHRLSIASDLNINPLISSY